MSTTMARETQPRLNQRLFSAADAGRRRNGQPTYRHLPQSQDVHDLPTTSAKQILASLRFLILSYLADLEASLSQLQSSFSDFRMAELVKAKGELTVAVWANVALEMLDNIRMDVRSHLPEFHFADISVERFVKSHIHELPDVAFLNEICSVVVDFSLADMPARLEDVRVRFSDLDFQPLCYLPILSEHLQSLHVHMTSLEVPSELIWELTEDVDEAEALVDLAAQEVRDAVRRSLAGSRLIQYHDLPPRWRNNPYVLRGYRFIPIERWPLIIRSLFAFHNQTLNIHTHLIPLVLWSVSFISIINSATLGADGPEVAFAAFTLVCLFNSVLWHTMSGCAHHVGREFCARVDYVGISWLISASVGTVVYYGFQCYPYIGQIFLVCCLLIGIAGNIFAFMDWFNTYEYRMWRISFFLSLAFSGVAPLATLVYLHGAEVVFNFINPVGPSILSYLLGLGFYVTHIPERLIVDKEMARWLDFMGVGSHAIWHLFIVLGMSQYKMAMERMRNGMRCEA